ncbi:MAG: hypothetical protein AAGH19_03945 [Pseudomonadota bacterium]
MARTAGIIQSINAAWRLVQETGFMDVNRGLNTESWQRNLNGAARELNEAADSLTARDNRDAYGELNNEQRMALWSAILASEQPAIGVRIISALGVRYSNIPQDLGAAESALSSRANGFPVRHLRTMAQRIRNAAPDRASVVERRAAEAGDPPPREVTRDEAELYQRIMLRAMQLSEREASSYRNAGDAALGAFGASLMPPNSVESWAQGEVEGRSLSILFGERANTAGLVFSALRAVNDGLDAHRRLRDDEYRLQHWVREVCLRESDGSAQQGLALFQRLQDILERLNGWLEWLDRHRDHPAYNPPGGVIRAAPTASLQGGASGAGRRSGPVHGSIRGPSQRGPSGMA